MSLFTAFNHVFPILDFIADSYTGGRYATCFKLDKAAHATIVLLQGATTSGAPQGDILLYACSDNTGSNPVAIPFRYREMTTADVMGTTQNATAAGVATTAGAQHMFVIEVDARELPAGGDYLRLHVAAHATGVCPGGAVAILSELREKPYTASAIA